MNGPAHYRRAEELERLAVAHFDAGGPGKSRADHYLDRAKVHATLALVAATWDGSQIAGGFGVDSDVANPWIEATS